MVIVMGCVMCDIWCVLCVVCYAWCGVCRVLCVVGGMVMMGWCMLYGVC